MCCNNSANSKFGFYPQYFSGIGLLSIPENGLSGVCGCLSIGPVSQGKPSAVIKSSIYKIQSFDGIPRIIYGPGFRRKFENRYDPRPAYDEPAVFFLYHVSLP